MRPTAAIELEHAAGWGRITQPASRERGHGPRAWRLRIAGGQIELQPVQGAPSEERQPVRYRAPDRAPQAVAFAAWPDEDQRYFLEAWLLRGAHPALHAQMAEQDRAGVPAGLDLEQLAMFHPGDPWRGVLRPSLAAAPAGAAIAWAGDKPMLTIVDIAYRLILDVEEPN